MIVKVEGGVADVIVVAYLSEQVITECVDNLLDDGSVRRVIVVNNTPNDPVSSMFNAVDDVLVIDAPGNIGFGNAVNLAGSHCSSSWIAIVNPDAVQEPGTVGECIEFLRSYPRAGMVGPRVVWPDGSLQLTSQRDYGLFRMVVTSIGGPSFWRIERPGRDHASAHETEYLVGAYLCCRRQALDDVGWFNTSIFLFGEDQDLSRRMRQLGWEVWYAPIGKVVHQDAHSSNQVPDIVRYHSRRARYQQLMASGRWIQAEVYRFLVKVMGRWA